MGKDTNCSCTGPWDCQRDDVLNEFYGTNPALSHWVKFDPSNAETYPKFYGKYLICRKDGKIYWETWNGSGWAYNGNVIVFWAVIVPPVI